MVLSLPALRRISGALCLCSVLTACASHNKPANTESALQLPQVVGHADFNWRLSGNRRVAPKQIFSDDQRIWLQWSRRQPIPIIFGMDEDQWQVLEPRQVGAYLLIEGQWSAIKFQGGKLQALAQKIDRYETDYFQRQFYSSQDTESGMLSEPTAQSMSAAGTPQQTESHPSLSPTPSKGPRYAAILSDRTIRQVIQRWAKASAWHFENSHWAVDIDLPVTAQARFTQDFMSSVQQLLATTEMSDRPLQPCFYTNKVLRVIPIAQTCDPQVRKGSRA